MRRCPHPAPGIMPPGFSACGVRTPPHATRCDAPKTEALRRSVFLSCNDVACDLYFLLGGHNQKEGCIHGEESSLCDALDLKQPTISHHLGLLRMGRLVVGTRQGKSVVYVADAAILKDLVAGLAKLTPSK